jgi:8-oxo-dGTP diphosphatase
LLYTVTGWEGVPQALEGGEVGWFTPQAVRALDKPPLDIALASQLLQNR